MLLGTASPVKILPVRGAYSVLNTDIQSSGTNALSYPFTVALGASHPTRIVWVGEAHRAAATETTDSISLGGTRMEEKVQAAPSTGTVVSWWGRKYPQGETTDIVVTTSNTVLRCGIVVFVSYGKLHPSIHDAQTGTNSASFALPQRGTALCVAATANGTTMTWSNATEIPEITWETSAGVIGAGQRTATDAEASTSITVTYGTSTSPGFAGITFGPW